MILSINFFSIFSIRKAQKMAKSFCPAHVWGDFLQTDGDLKKKSADLSFFEDISGYTMIQK